MENNFEHNIVNHFEIIKRNMNMIMKITTMSIKKNNPERRKAFRARHNCKNPGPKWKARYWSCRAW